MAELAARIVVSSERVLRETPSISQEGHIFSLSLGKTPHFETLLSQNHLKGRWLSSDTKYVYLLFLNVRQKL